MCDFSENKAAMTTDKGKTFFIIFLICFSNLVFSSQSWKHTPWTQESYKNVLLQNWSYIFQETILIQKVGSYDFSELFWLKFFSSWPVSFW